MTKEMRKLQHAQQNILQNDQDYNTKVPLYSVRMSINFYFFFKPKLVIQ